VQGATVRDIFPETLNNVTFTSVAAGGASDNLASGADEINDVVNIPVGGSITYNVQATVGTDAPNQLPNTATITAPTGTTDTNDDNDSSSVTVTINAGADLSITKDDSRTTVRAGDEINYDIVVTNVGAVDVTGARVTDTLPAVFNPVSFTSQAFGGATGNTVNGNGNIDDTVNIPVDGEIRYTVTATLSNTATGTVMNTARVAPPQGVTDVDPSNDSATDVDTITPEVDLRIEKTNRDTNVSGGDQLTYTITVTNEGPDTATGARIQDDFSDDFMNVNFTSVASGGATGNTSAAGDIDNTVTMPPDSTIVYTVTAQVVEQTDDDEISNTARVTAPTGVTDTDPENNEAVDTDTVDAALAQLSGSVYVDGDNDGVFDPGETPIRDVRVILRRNGAEIERTTTNAAGAFSFDELDPDTYEVVEEQATGFTDGRDTASGGIGSTTQNDVFTVPLTAGDNATGLNFGERTRPSKRDLLASSFGT
jgi:uncharacterized repeat protein (TIGR01451 family)